MPRFFSDDSYWNRPLEREVEVDPRSDAFIADMDAKFGAMHINIAKFSIPVYYAGADTPRRKVHQKRPDPDTPADMLQRESRYRQHPDFAASAVPIPQGALPDPDDDAHIAIVDWNSRTAWDMWRCRVRPDGEYESSTGMVYSLESDGVWRREDFPIRNGESMHYHGPSRAAGVPAIAGLILHEEILAGRIEHKLAFACASNRRQAHTYPATWTDGAQEDGLPQGAVLQLDPSLDLGRFELSPAARTIARAMQEYGAVDVDGARGNTLYAEGLQFDRERSWESVLDHEDLRCIPLRHYRILKLGPIVPEGDTFWYERRRKRQG